MFTFDRYSPMQGTRIACTFLGPLEKYSALHEIWTFNVTVLYAFDKGFTTLRTFADYIYIY